MVSKGDRHPTDLAGLRGARLVIVSELEKGARWAEAKIKALTGGDKISARFMRQDFFEFTVTFKIMISGNHKPSLSAVNEAVRRRFHLIPFSVTIPPAERDIHFFDKLKSEWPGILKWMCEGYLEWHEKGLGAPPSRRRRHRGVSRRGERPRPVDRRVLRDWKPGLLGAECAFVGQLEGLGRTP